MALLELYDKKIALVLILYCVAITNLVMIDDGHQSKNFEMGYESNPEIKCVAVFCFFS